MTLVCFAMAAGIDPGMNFNVNSPMHIGNYSGCTKKITKLENQNNSFTSIAYITLEISIIATLITVYVLPILVVLPIGGGKTEMRRSHSHCNTTGDKKTTDTGTKKRTRSKSDNNEHDDSPGNKKPKNVGRPQNFTDHVCKDCHIWSQSGSHPSLQATHTCTKMRYPNAKIQEMSEYASYSGITIALYPDSCICQQSYADFQRKPLIPR